MTDVDGLIQQTGAEKLNIATLFPEFHTLRNKEDTAIEAIRKSPLTSRITEADAVRDSVFRGFTLTVEAFSYHPNVVKVQAAEDIRVVIDHYGDLRSKSYNEETASIHNLLEDVNSRCADDVALLGIQEWIDELSVANRAFHDLMSQRFDAAAQEITNLREVRKEIDRMYGAMVDRINASILLYGEEPYAEFVKKLNERIAYFKTTVAIRRGRARKATEGGKES
jgi:hypothetical protein